MQQKLSNGQGWPSAPSITRVRHDLHRRSLTVTAVERLTPHMIRITLGGAELAGFTSAAPDDHIKIFIPQKQGEDVRRDYTPRRYDPAAAMLVLDFVDHHGGPAAAWARAARVGDRLDIGGPKGSQVIADDVRQWLLVGDETALPAIGRRVEALPAQATVTTVVAVPEAADEQTFATCARHGAYWVHRPTDQADQAQALVAVLAKLPIPEGTFVWVGAEAHVARAIRQYLLEDRGIPAQWVKSAGYWVKGQADASVRDVETMR